MKQAIPAHRCPAVHPLVQTDLWQQALLHVAPKVQAVGTGEVLQEVDAQIIERIKNRLSSDMGFSSRRRMRLWKM